MTGCDTRIHPDKATTGAAISAALASRIREAIDARGAAHIVLTGGSMGSASLVGLRDHEPVDWARVHIWWGDERFVRGGDADRNETQARQALLDDPSAAAAHLHVMPAVDGPDGEDLVAAATRYAAELSGHAAPGDDVPRFDVLMLGVGPDAHIASLFPRHPAQTVVDAATVAVEDSPKPPPRRISLTYPAINAAREVWFMVAGTDKADAVRAATAEGADRWDTPAVGAHGTEATIWWLDEAAASKLHP